MNETAKYIITAGIALVLIGIIWNYFNKYFMWFGNLPGDINWMRGNTKIYFPVVSLIILSLVINLLWWLYKYLTK